MLYEEEHEPTVAEVAMDLWTLVETHAPTDDDLELLAGPLLGLGTRSQWRDAFFYVDLDGEDPPEDHAAIPFRVRALHMDELYEILTCYPLAPPVRRRDVELLARVMTRLASPAEWQSAFEANGPSRD
jgi:hypothetical protein